MKAVTDWLTEPAEPSVRYLAMRDLMESSRGDLRQAWERIPAKGWVKTIFDLRLPDGSWFEKSNLYAPKFLSTNWMLLTLSDLGVTRRTPWVAESAELWRDAFAKPDGGFAPPGRKSELCFVGNTARALLKLGYEDDPRVRRAFLWLAKNQAPNGGWDCFGRNGVIDGWEGMSAFAELPRQKWTRSMKSAADRGLEFYLERRLLREGRHYDPWFRFHFPYHYFYDALLGLEFVTALGGGSDPRAARAVSLLKKKRRSDGRWLLEATQPDTMNTVVSKGLQEYINKIRPFTLEAAGKPSKMITLRALRVLKRLGEPVPDLTR